MNLDCFKKQFNCAKVVIAVALQIWAGVITPEPLPNIPILKAYESPTGEDKGIMDPAHGAMRVRNQMTPYLAMKKKEGRPVPQKYTPIVSR